MKVTKIDIGPQYTMWDQTPMKWHKFLIYFSIPLTVVINICVFVKALADYTSLHPDIRWFWICNIVFFGSACVLSFLAEYLLVRREWRGVIMLLACYVLNATYMVVCAALYAALRLDQWLISQATSAAIWSAVSLWINYVYYKKRRALFAPMQIDSPKATKPVAAARVSVDETELESETSSVALLAGLQDSARNYANEQAPKEKIHRIVPVYALAAVSLFLVLVLVAFGVMFVKYQGLQEQHKQTVSNLNIEKDTTHYLRGEVKEKNRIISNYRDQVAENMSELRFWKQSAVIVTESGQKYHTYSCQYVEGRSFWIYNVEAARGRGYKPCSVCNPPN